MFVVMSLAAAVALAQRPTNGGILDRIAVTVARQVISEGDLVRDLRVAAFLDQKPVDLSGAEKRKAADRLVDQALILQELTLTKLKVDAEEPAANALAEVKKQYAGEGEYQAALTRYGVTEAQVLDHLIAGIRALRFTDLRFRPEIEIKEDDLRDAYNKLTEDSRKKGIANIPSFEASHDDLEKFVASQRLSQALDRWLGSQHTQTEILYREQVFK
jgi:hypothetical protein